MSASRQFGGWSNIMKRTVLMSVILAATAFSGFALADDDKEKHSRYNEYQNNGFVRDVGDDDYENSRDNQYGNTMRYDNARVLSVDPIIDEHYQQSRRECWVEPGYQSSSYRRTGYRDDNYTDRYNDDSQRNRRSSNNSNAIIGGVIGGVLGNQVGKGNGRRAATVAGAVLGYAIAREVSKDNSAYRDERYSDRGYSNDDYSDNNRNSGYQTEPASGLRCRMVNDDRYDYGYQSNGDRGDRNQYVNSRYQDRYNHDRYDNRYENARVTGYRVTFRYHNETFTTVTDYHPGSTIRVRVNVTADHRGDGNRNSEYAGY
jgi:uncharacterized protein YcfJ